MAAKGLCRLLRYGASSTSGHNQPTLCCPRLLHRTTVLEQGPQALPSTLMIVTDMGRSSKEQGNCIVKEAVNSMMAFWQAPFKCVVALGTAAAALTYAPGVIEMQLPPLLLTGVLTVRCCCLLRRPAQNCMYTACLEAAGPIVAEWVLGQDLSALLAGLFPTSDTDTVGAGGRSTWKKLARHNLVWLH